MLTEGVDYADTTKSTHDDVADIFKFTNGNDIVEANSTTLTTNDILIDEGTADTDVLKLNLGVDDAAVTIGDPGIGAGARIVGIEELHLIGNKAGAVTFDNTIKMGGLKTINVSGSVESFEFDGSVSVMDTLKTIDLTGITIGSEITVDATSATQGLTISGPKYDGATVTGGDGDDVITLSGIADSSVDGGNGNDTIVANGTVDGGSGNDTITGKGSIDGSDGDDMITLTGTSTVSGGSGADIIVTSKEGVVQFTYSGTGETANVGTGDVEVAKIADTVKKVAKDADTLTVKVGDTIDLSTITLLASGSGVLQNEGKAFADNLSELDDTSGKGDIFVLKAGTDYFLVYEADGSGSTSELGSGAEVIKLLGFTADNTITLDNGIVTIQ